MKPAHHALLMLFVCLSALSLWPADASSSTASGPADAGQQEAPFLIGGVGGAYFLAEPGEFWIDLEKRDRHRRATPAELRAILVGPDRQVIQEITIPGDTSGTRGRLGPPQRVRLATRVPRKGVYGLNVTVSQDRYGEHVVWGFRTSCKHWLIETSRGHRDERRQEAIVFHGLPQAGELCFLPRKGPFAIEIAGLPKGASSPAVYDSAGQQIASLAVDADGRASHEFAAKTSREGGPWRLHLPVQQATVQIDGVTRWGSRDLYPNLPCWTPESASFFPLLPYRWIVTPYQRTVYGQPGQPGEIGFRVHNNADGPRTIQLELEFPGAAWPVELASRRVKLGAKQAAIVSLRYTVPAAGQSAVCHLRATPVEDPEFSTYSTLTVRAGVAPATKPLAIPLVLKPYAHENEQFGYLPDYPVENQVYFDRQNRPWVRTGAGLATLRDGKWTQIRLDAAVVTGLSLPRGAVVGSPSAKIAFDGDGDVYLLGSAGRQVALLHGRADARSFTAHVIPGREKEPRGWDLEQFSGHNGGEGPPALLRSTRTDRDEDGDPRLRWRAVNDLELFWPTKTSERIDVGPPVMLSRKCIGISAHSGIPSCVVAREGRAHAVWGEASDPKEKLPGIPTYVVSYDRTRGLMGPPVLVAYGPPANDVHNTPSITMDSRGYLHVLAGTHGQPFPYVQSQRPHDAHGGWSEPVPAGAVPAAGEGQAAPGGPAGAARFLRQTYIGLVCGPDDTLHLTCRLWKQGEAPFPASSFGTLAYVRKPAGKSWELPRVLIVPPFSEYSVYYHRLTLDRGNRLYLSYDYFSTFWFYRTDHAGSRRALLSSPDGGQTWQLAAFGRP